MRLAPALLMLLTSCSSSTTGSPDGGRVIEAEVCSRAGVDDALGRAVAGDTVRFGACVIDGGELTVPAGVTLEGAGAAESGVEIDGFVGLVPAAEGCTTLRGVRILSDGPHAIATAGPGDVCIEDVELETTLGVGIIAQGTTRLVVRRSRMTGSVTPDNADSLPMTEEETSSFGLTAQCVEHVELEDVEASGFSFGGVRVVSSRLTWRGGRVSVGMGTGVHVALGEATLEDLEIFDMLQGLRLIPVYGLVTDQSRVETTNLTIRDSAGVGALHNGGLTAHASLRIADIVQQGLWIQAGALVIEGGSVQRSAAAALMAVGATDLRVEDTELGGTLLATLISGETMAIQVGAGLVVARGHDGPLTLRRVQIENNEGWGALILLAPGYAHPFVIEDVSVTPSMRGFGIHDGPPPSGWQAGVSPPEATLDAIEPALIGYLEGPRPPSLPAFNPSCD